MSLYCKLAVVLLLIGSCKSKIASTPEENFGKQSYYSVMLDGTQSNIADQQVRVITNQDDLIKIYRAINSTRKPGHEIPNIDWNKNTVIAAFTGTRNTGGYAIEVFQVINEQGSLYFKFNETAPDATTLTSQVITTPFKIILVPHHDKKITASF